MRPIWNSTTSSTEEPKSEAPRPTALWSVSTGRFLKSSSASSSGRSSMNRSTLYRKTWTNGWGSTIQSVPISANAEAELAEMRRILPDLDEKKRREAERRLSVLERQLRKEKGELRMKIMKAEWKSKDAADEHSHALFMQTIG